MFLSWAPKYTHTNNPYLVIHQTAEYTTSQQSRPDIHQPINQFNIGENKQLNSTVPVQYNSLINDEARNPPEFSESSQNLPENPPMIKPELKPRVRRKENTLFKIIFQSETNLC